MISRQENGMEFSDGDGSNVSMVLRNDLIF